MSELMLRANSPSNSTGLDGSIIAACSGSLMSILRAALQFAQKSKSIDFPCIYIYVYTTQCRLGCFRILDLRLGTYHRSTLALK